MRSQVARNRIENKQYKNALDPVNSGTTKESEAIRDMTQYLQTSLPDTKQVYQVYQNKHHLILYWIYLVQDSRFVPLNINTKVDMNNKILLPKSSQIFETIEENTIQLAVILRTRVVYAGEIFVSSYPKQPVFSNNLLKK